MWRGEPSFRRWHEAHVPREVLEESIKQIIEDAGPASASRETSDCAGGSTTFGSDGQPSGSEEPWSKGRGKKAVEHVGDTNVRSGQNSTEIVGHRGMDALLHGEERSCGKITEKVKDPAATKSKATGRG